MGGLAFSHPGPNGEPALKTPRIPPGIYHQLRERYLQKLKSYYAEVTALTEVPGKADYGDIDILVKGPLHDLTADQLTQQLGAVRYVIHGKVTSFAIPREDDHGTFAQLDVELCPNGFIRWEVFLNSWGDLWQILGAIIREAGLTASDKGLHVRIPEVEQESNRKASRMFLTNDPVETMRFLGLDAAKYDAGFESMDEIYEFCAGCRFFNQSKFQLRVEFANDRRRKQTREMFRIFFDDWLPAHPEAGSQNRAHTREEVLQEAVRTFERDNEYKSSINSVLAGQAERALWSHIVAIIPVHSDAAMKLTVRGLKRWTRFDNGEPRLRESPIVDYEDMPPWVSLFPPENKEKVIRWVGAHWMTVKLQEKRRVAALKYQRRH